VIGGVYSGEKAIAAYALEGLGINPGVNPNNVTVQYFTNGVDTQTRGLDLALKYVTEFDGGYRVNWNAGANFSHTDIQRIGDDLNGNPLVNAQFASFITTATPSYKVTFGPNLTAGKWDVNLHEILWGPTKTLQQYNAGPNAFSETVFGVQDNQSRFQTDLQVSYKVTDWATLAIGATDLFNEEPTRLPAIFSYAGVIKYDYYSEQMNINGGFYYAKFQVKF
jgi:iron complex outermembrane receptor protein